MVEEFLQHHLKENQFWLNVLSLCHHHRVDPEIVHNYEEMVEKLSVPIIQQAAKDYLNTNNYVKVVLYPEIVD